MLIQRISQHLHRMIIIKKIIARGSSLSGAHGVEVRLCLPVHTHVNRSHRSRGQGDTSLHLGTLDPYEGLRRQRWAFAGCSWTWREPRRLPALSSGCPWIGRKCLGQESEQLARLLRGSAGGTCPSMSAYVCTHTHMGARTRAHVCTPTHRCGSGHLAQLWSLQSQAG